MRTHRIVTLIVAMASTALAMLSAQPRFDRFEAENTGRARVWLSGVSGQLQPQGRYLSGFELAGDDGIFYAASAKVVAADELLVLCDGLCHAEPTAVRYVGGELTDQSGLPVEPFSSVASVYDRLLYPSFRNLLMCGYQAWFQCPGDYFNQGYSHLANGGAFRPGQECIEYWPDMTEYTKTYATPFVYPDGTPARIFSSVDDETLDLHFRWMQEYGIDGALLQRFKSSVESRPWTRELVGKALEAAKRYNRAFIVEYDLSGLGGEQSVQGIIDDWNWLCDEYGLNDPERCPNYVWEGGRPVVGFFGVGLGGKTCKPEQYLEMFDKMRGRDNEAGAIAPLAGTGYYWRAGGSDALDFTAWEPVYKRCAIISPWAVGRYSSQTAFTQKRSIVLADLRWCQGNNVVYSPVAFPGFSWRNAKTTWSGGTPSFPSDTPYDQIPREKGAFFQKQLDTYLMWGVDAIFVAMFDEMDEGTAIFKLADREHTPLNSSEANPEGRFLYTEDGLETDHYLKLAGAAAAELKK